MIYIGIDPGLSGAVGVLTEIDPYIRPEVYDTPTALIEGEKTKRRHLTGSMARLLLPYAHRHDVLAVLENVHSMPKQGVASSFCFGEGKGMWEGILAALEIPMELVSPQRWKKGAAWDSSQASTPPARQRRSSSTSPPDPRW